MDWLNQAAGWLRDLLSRQAWLDGAQSVIACTPDWALLAPPGLAILTLFALLLRLTWPKPRPPVNRRPPPPQQSGESRPGAARVAAAPAFKPSPKPIAVEPAASLTPAPKAGYDEDNRSVRVFVSSTFLDMQAERDELVTKTFPALRAKYRARGVEVFEVDLRWGITREQQERGEALPTLLAEIDRCRPYFIGLLGDRYGWVPPAAALTDKLKADYPAVAEARGASITAMEIIHGVLANPDTAARACFFERDPDWDWRTKLDDADRTAATVEPEEVRARLADLKIMIRQKARVETYARPGEIGEKVSAVLDGLLDARFPESDAPDAFEQTGRLHRAYARERRGLHVGAEGYMRHLNRWMATKGASPLLITGASGGGKSTLIANWLHSWSKEHPNDIIFEHYLGASPDSADPILIMRRLLEYLGRTTGETDTPPGNANLMDVSTMLAQRLARARLHAERGGGRLLIGLDGLDKLSSEQSLRWLPIAPGVHWLASSLPDGEAAALERGFVPLEVKPLGEQERRDFIAGTLARWRRTLEPQYIAAILQPAAAELAGSPLYLKTVLDELRVSADNARLAERLEDYRSAHDMPDLFDRVLTRLEDDCEAGLVVKALPLVWASRAGLEEAEILAITGASPLAWATLRNGLGDGLRDQQGRIAFGHDFLRQAVASRYLRSDEHRRSTHLALADRFEARGPDARQAEELPYQLRAASSWERLETVLLDLDRFMLLRTRGDGELLSNWLPLKERGRDPEERLCTEFFARAGDPRQWTRADLYLAFALFNFLYYLGATNDRFGLGQKRTEACEILLGPEHSDTLTSMSDQATIMFARGELEAAQRLNEEVLAVRTRLFGADHPLTLRSMSNLGFTLFGRGDFERARSVEERALDAQTRLLGAEHPHTLLSLSNKAATLREMGDIDGALALQERVLEAQTRVLGPEHPDSLFSLSGIGNSLRMKGDLARAQAIESRALEMSTRILGGEHPSTLMTMNNLAQTLKAGGDLEATQELEERVLETNRRLFGAEQLNTLVATSNLVMTRLMRGDLDGALLLLFPALEVMERVLGSEHSVTLTSKSDFALILATKGEMQDALSLQEEVFETRRRVLGPTHNDTRASAEILEMLRSRASGASLE